MRPSRHALRLAARVFARHRTYSAVAVLSLGLAIALNTTMYSVIDAMVNPRTDLAHPERLYYIKLVGDVHGKVDAATRASLLSSGFKTYDALSTFERASNQVAALEHGARLSEGAVAFVAPNIFSTIGARPAAGRGFTDADASDPSSPVVISKTLASELFAGALSPVGNTMQINGASHPVIGVVAEGMQLPGSHYAVWMLPPPSTAAHVRPADIIRLREGMQLEDLERELKPIAERVANMAGQGPRDARYDLQPVRARQFSLMRFHFALIAAVVAVLLIACANLANLQLARGLGRNRELALRVALGATRRDIMVHLLLESTVLAVAGLILGLVLTVWGNGILAAHIPPSVGEYVIAPQTSWRVFVVAGFACLLCITIIGLAPAVQVSRVDPNALLKAGAGTGANRRNRHKYSFMIVVEIGLSLALLSGMALLLRSAAGAHAVDLGYDLRPLIGASVIDSVSAGPDATYVGIENAIIDRVRALPDVTDAAVAIPHTVIDFSTTVTDVDGEKRIVATPAYEYSVVSPSYFRTMRRRIIQGRDFTDGVSSDGELIVDEPSARFLWPNGRAVGSMMKLGRDSSHAAWVRIIGVVKPVRRVNPWLFNSPEEFDQHMMGSVFYRPGANDGPGSAAKFHWTVVTARVSSDPERQAIALRRELGQGGRYRVYGSGTMEEFLGLRQLRQNHDFMAAVFVSFALLALALAALGIYGIVAHSVAERRRELGVRIALGASARDVLHAVLREGAPVALGGVAVGLLFTKYTVQWLQAFSFRDDQYDAVLFGAMGAVLFVVALAAAFVPALRATRIDPVESLRAE